MKFADIPSCLRPKAPAWAALIAVTVLSGGCGTGTDYTEQNRLPSPGGLIVAVTYIASGGGAAGWCDTRVALTAKGAAANLGQIDSRVDYVFSASCDSDVKLTWLSEIELQISYAVSDSGVTVMQQRRTGFGGHVHLVYLPRS